MPLVCSFACCKRVSLWRRGVIVVGASYCFLQGGKGLGESKRCLCCRLVSQVMGSCDVFVQQRCDPNIVLAVFSTRPLVVVVAVAALHVCCRIMTL